MYYIVNHDRETAMPTYKSLNSLAPEYLMELFTKCSEGNGQTLCSRETNLQMPVLRISMGQNAFWYRGAKIWNELSQEAKLAPWHSP